MPWYRLVIHVIVYFISDYLHICFCNIRVCCLHIYTFINVGNKLNQTPKELSSFVRVCNIMWKKIVFKSNLWSIDIAMFWLWLFLDETKRNCEQPQSPKSTSICIAMRHSARLAVGRDAWWDTWRPRSPGQMHQGERLRLPWRIEYQLQATASADRHLPQNDRRFISSYMRCSSRAAKRHIAVIKLQSRTKNTEKLWQISPIHRYRYRHRHINMINVHGI